MEYLISMYMDNELDLDDKITFVKQVHSDRSYFNETIELLNQEKLIRSEAIYRAPALYVKPGWNWRDLLKSFIRPFGIAAASVAATVLFIFLFLPAPKDPLIENRFVIFRPDVNRAEITGTFTNWQKIPMNRIGASGYWEIVLPVPRGEHRFTYILEGHNRFADPTILTREKDDFGGENTIILVGDRV